MNYRLISITLSILSGSCFLVNNKIECAPKNQLDKERMDKIEIVALECGNMEAPPKERLTQLKKEFKREKLTDYTPVVVSLYEKTKGFRERHPNWNSIGSVVGGAAAGAIIATGAIVNFDLFGGKYKSGK